MPQQTMSHQTMPQHNIPEQQASSRAGLFSPSPGEIPRGPQPFSPGACTSSPNLPVPLPSVPSPNLPQPSPLPRTTTSGQKPIRIRTPAQVQKDTPAEVLLSIARDSFPLGPLNMDHDGLLQQIKHFSTNTHIGGGGFGVTKDGHDGNPNGTTTHGKRVRFSCNQKGASKFSCLWSIIYEWTTCGWMGVKYHGAHDRVNPSSATLPKLPAHELLQTQAEVSVSSSGRFIPIELHEVGRTLAAVCTPILVHEGLQKEAKKRGIDHNTWNAKDVSTMFPSDSSVGNDFDAYGLIERLERNRSELGLEYRATVDKSSHLNKIFVEIHGAREDWAVGQENNVLLFDPTHSTNRYGLKLCFFVTVGCTGQTVVLAFTLLKHESVADMKWSFQCFADIFRTPPATLLTDGCTSRCNLSTSLHARLNGFNTPRPFMLWSCCCSANPLH